jgi:hypothetical protein
VVWLCIGTFISSPKRLQMCSHGGEMTQALYAHMNNKKKKVQPRWRTTVRKKLLSIFIFFAYLSLFSPLWGFFC